MLPAKLKADSGSFTFRYENDIDLVIGLDSYIVSTAFKVERIAKQS